MRDLVLGMFQEVLGEPGIGLDSDFFAAGGHSLSAMRLVAQVRSRLEVEIHLRDLFRHPTPSLLTERISQLPPARRPGPERSDRITDGTLVPLSFAQERLWFIDKLSGANPFYTIPLAFRLLGRFDVVSFKRALLDVVERHPALRTVYRHVAGIPFQEVCPTAAAVPSVDVIACEPSGLIEELESALLVPFDLAQGPLVRAKILQLSADESVLLITIHHIAADGWSVAPIMRDLGDAYNARTLGRGPRWDPLPLTPADHALLQRNGHGDGAGQEGLDYWRQELAGLPDELALPYSVARPIQESHRGRAIRLQLDADTHERLVQLARNHRATLFMVLHASFLALLKLRGVGDDLVIGTAVAGRDDRRLDQVVGFFVNSLVLRVDCAGATRFGELLERVRETDLSAYDHSDVPFEKVVQAVRPPRRAGRNPLFQTMFSMNTATLTAAQVLDLPNLRETSTPLPEFSGLETKPEPIPWSTAKFDLHLGITELRRASAEGIDIWAEYAIDLFEGQVISDLLEDWQRLIEAVVNDPDVSISGSWDQRFPVEG